MWKLTTAHNAVAYGSTAASSIKSLSARSRLPHHVDAVRTSDSRERIGTRIGTKIGMRSGVLRESAAVNHGLESCLTLVSTDLTSAERNAFLDAASEKTGR